MTKIYLESTPIFKVVTPAIDSGIKKLDKALSYLNSAKAPTGYSSSLISKKNRINEIKRELYKVEEYLESSTKQIDNLENGMIDRASSLPKNEIPLREEKVK